MRPRQVSDLNDLNTELRPYYCECRLMLTGICNGFLPCSLIVLQTSRRKSAVKVVAIIELAFTVKCGKFLSTIRPQI